METDPFPAILCRILTHHFPNWMLDSISEKKVNLIIFIAGNLSPSDIQSGKRKKLTVGDVFNTDDDDSADGSKKRKLVPLDYDDDKLDKKASTAEEKRAKIKTLIESIPTAKDELFAYSLDWSIVDQVSGLVYAQGCKFFFSCSTRLSTKFQQLIKTKIPTNKEVSHFKSLRCFIYHANAF